MIDILMPTVHPRLTQVLGSALSGIPHRYLSTDSDLRGKRILFALHCDDGGIDSETLALLRRLRKDPSAMAGSTAALIADGTTELYTKQLAQDITLAANSAGCLFPGKPLVEGTGSLYNQHIIAAQMNASWEETYVQRAQELCFRLADFTPPQFRRPRLVILHASEHGRSATLWLGTELAKRLETFCDIKELSLRNGTVYDCRGCSYSACLHYAQNNSCFYGGAIADTILPAILNCDAMLFLCPNYNDAVGANITALFNRLTGLLLRSDLYEKYLYGIVVSGYSGGDLVARQLLGAMCLNKTAILPPHFCMLQTANDLDHVQQIPEISGQLDAYALRIRKALCKETP